MAVIQSSLGLPPLRPPSQPGEEEFLDSGREWELFEYGLLEAHVGMARMDFWFRSTAPGDSATICIRRSVEELPRMPPLVRYRDGKLVSPNPRLPEGHARLCISDGWSWGWRVYRDLDLSGKPTAHFSWTNGRTSRPSVPQAGYVMIWEGFGPGGVNGVIYLIPCSLLLTALGKHDSHLIGKMVGAPLATLEQDLVGDIQILDGGRCAKVAWKHGRLGRESLFQLVTLLTRESGRSFLTQCNTSWKRNGGVPNGLVVDHPFGDVPVKLDVTWVDMRDSDSPIVVHSQKNKLFENVRLVTSIASIEWKTGLERVDLLMNGSPKSEDSSASPMVRGLSNVVRIEDQVPTIADKPTVSGQEVELDPVRPTSFPEQRKTELRRRQSVVPSVSMIGVPLGGPEIVPDAVSFENGVSADGEGSVIRGLITAADGPSGGDPDVGPDEPPERDPDASKARCILVPPGELGEPLRSLYLAYRVMDLSLRPVPGHGDTDGLIPLLESPADWAGAWQTFDGVKRSRRFLCLEYAGSNKGYGYVLDVERPDPRRGPPIGIFARPDGYRMDAEEISTVLHRFAHAAPAPRWDGAGYWRCLTLKHAIGSEYQLRLRLQRNLQNRLDYVVGA